MLKIVHLELAEANKLVETLHRHHKPAVGHRFSIGVMNDNVLCGAAIIGRPVSREINYKEVVEVTRLVTDGTKNACSILYAAAARAARELGYRRIQTYILGTELGTSLRAAGWTFDVITSGGNWNHGWRKGRRIDQPMLSKQRWTKELN